jgi:hypothetical protein
MAVYFKLGCFDFTATANVLVFANIIIACLGAVHWGCTNNLTKIAE